MKPSKRAVVGAAVLSAGLAMAGSAYAILPPGPTVPPANVPAGTLAGKTSLNVLSVDAFTRAINQAHGSNAVLTRVHFNDGQSTGWHTHPGPNIVLVVAGELKLTDARCDLTTYDAGQGFATGLDTHEAVAVGPTDFYALYMLPADATVLRTDANPPGCATQGSSTPGGHLASARATTPGNKSLCDPHYLNACVPDSPDSTVSTASHPNGAMYYTAASPALLASLGETAPGVVGARILTAL